MPTRVNPFNPARFQPGENPFTEQLKLGYPPIPQVKPLQGKGAWFGNEYQGLPPSDINDGRYLSGLLKFRHGQHRPAEDFWQWANPLPPLWHMATGAAQDFLPTTHAAWLANKAGIYDGPVPHSGSRDAMRMLWDAAKTFHPDSPISPAQALGNVAYGPHGSIAPLALVGPKAFSAGGKGYNRFIGDDLRAIREVVDGLPVPESLPPTRPTLGNHWYKPTAHWVREWAPGMERPGGVLYEPGYGYYRTIANDASRLADILGEIRPPPLGRPTVRASEGQGGTPWKHNPAYAGHAARIKELQDWMQRERLRHEGEPMPVHPDTALDFPGSVRGRDYGKVMPEDRLSPAPSALDDLAKEVRWESRLDPGVAPSIAQWEYAARGGGPRKSFSEISSEWKRKDLEDAIIRANIEAMTPVWGLTGSRTPLAQYDWGRSRPPPESQFTKGHAGPSSLTLDQLRWLQERNPEAGAPTSGSTSLMHPTSALFHKYPIPYAEGGIARNPFTPLPPASLADLLEGPAPRAGDLQKYIDRANERHQWLTEKMRRELSMEYPWNRLGEWFGED